MKLYHRTRYSKHVITIRFYTDAECTQYIGYARTSNFKTDKLRMSMLNEWYASSTVKSNQCNKTEMIWLDRIEIVEHRLSGLFRHIIETTLSKIRNLHKTDAIIALEAYSLDTTYGPSTKKLASIYKEFGFVKLKNTTTRYATIMSMKK